MRQHVIYLVLSLMAAAGLPLACAQSGEDPGDGIDQLVAEADPNRGRMLFLQCQACHTVNRGGEHRVGPNLFGVYQADAARAESFRYSAALREAGIQWTNDQLDRFLTRPSALVPGTAMVFVGVEKPADRAAIIKWLQQETQAKPAR